MTRLNALILSFCFFAYSGTAAPAGAAAETVIVHAGNLLSVPGRAPKASQSLIIRDGRVAEQRDGFVTPADIGEAAARVIDLSSDFVMPGFMDAHVHLTGQAGSGGKILRVTNSDADFALTAAMYAKRTLDAGFTTVRNLGSDGRAMFALRDAIKAGKVPGPRILVAGDAIAATGGHGDVHGFRPEVLAVIPSTGVCDGPDDCRRAVRLQVKRGADVIKITATGGVLSETNAGTGQQLTDEELTVIVETAHNLGRKVAAHAHEAAGIHAALRAGVDSIEHAMWATRDTMKLFKKMDTWLVPTVYPITAVGDTPEKMKKGPFKDLPPAIMEKLLRLGRQPKDMTKLAYEMGVKIALGTDSGVSPHGENANEFIEYVNIGMTPMEALMTGTVNTAELLGLSKDLGTLESGKIADLVALEGNPLENISAVLRVRVVMQAGVVTKD